MKENNQIDIELQKTKQKKEHQELRGKKIKVLFRKHKKIIGDYKRIVPLKEPVVHLLRRTGTVEYYENIKGDQFEFTHTDGEIYHINLTPKYLYDAQIGEQKYKTYFLHEDHAYPLPGNPIYETRHFTSLIENILSGWTKWKKAEQLKDTNKIIWTVAIGIVVIIIAIATWQYIIPSMFPKVATVAQSATQIPIG